MSFRNILTTVMLALGLLGFAGLPAGIPIEGEARLTMEQSVPHRPELRRATPVPTKGLAVSRQNLVTFSAAMERSPRSLIFLITPHSPRSPPAA
jgi:hypothetical protein